MNGSFARKSVRSPALRRSTVGRVFRQYQVRINPEALVKYDLTYDQVITAIDQE